VTVSLLGAPSLYSNVPMLVSTLSGVVIDAGICACVVVVKATAQASATTSFVGVPF